MLTRTPARRHDAWLATVAALTLSACSTAHRGSSPLETGATPQQLSAVRAANDRLETLFEAGDHRALAQMYEDDAVLLAPGGVRIAGREAIDAYWAPKPDRPAPTRRRWDLAIHRLEGVDTLLVQRGTSRLLVEIEGRWRESTVEFYVIWRRQSDGSYRIAVDAYWPT